MGTNDFVRRYVQEKISCKLSTIIENFMASSVEYCLYRNVVLPNVQPYPERTLFQDLKQRTKSFCLFHQTIQVSINYCIY